MASEPPSPARLRSLSPGISSISPPPIFSRTGVAGISPDDFLVSLHSTYRSLLIASVKRARQNLRRTLPSAEEFIDVLEAQRLTAFSAILRRKAAQLT